MEKKRIKLTVAYDGTDYHGWQYQPGAKTIEGELNNALSELLNEDITVVGASRTDAGVHALCNIAVFDTASPIPAKKISYALNRHLPPDIRIRKSEAAANDYHPRRVNSRKTYEYRIHSADFPIPTMRLYHHFTYHRLDTEKMQIAAEYLIGEHDFKSFCAVGAVVETTVRTIYEASVTAVKSDEIIITVTGNGFLYNMVRIIAGTLIDIGMGKYPPEHMKEIILTQNRTAAGPTAPAKGLSLININAKTFS